MQVDDDRECKVASWQNSAFGISGWLKIFFGHLFYLENMYFQESFVSKANTTLMLPCHSKTLKVSMFVYVVV